MKVLFIGVIAFLTGAISHDSIAGELSETERLDHSKYCYYADVAYSEGSLMVQYGRKMQCGRKSKAADLVWQEYSETEI